MRQSTQHRQSSVAEMRSPFLVLSSPDFSGCHYSCLFMSLLSALFSSLSVHLSPSLWPLCASPSSSPAPHSLPIHLLLTSSTYCSTLPSSFSHLWILYNSSSPSNLLAPSSAEFLFSHSFLCS